MDANASTPRANLGDSLGAKSDIKATQLYISDCADLDDISILNFRISAAAELIGDSITATTHKKIAMEYFDRFKQQQIDIKNIVFDAFPEIDSK